MNEFINRLLNRKGPRGKGKRPRGKGSVQESKTHIKLKKPKSMI